APAVVAAAATPASAPPVAAEPEVAAAEVTAPAEAPPAGEEPPAVAAAVEPAPAEEGALPGELSDDAESAAVSAVRSGLLSDPSDYSVAADGTIEVHPLETLGHYADWLGIRTQRLRDINGFAFGRPVEVGERIKLDLSRVDAEDRKSTRLNSSHVKISYAV